MRQGNKQTNEQTLMTMWRADALLIKNILFMGWMVYINSRLNATIHKRESELAGSLFFTPFFLSGKSSYLWFLFVSFQKEYCGFPILKYCSLSAVLFVQCCGLAGLFLPNPKKKCLLTFQPVHMALCPLGN